MVCGLWFVVFGLWFMVYGGLSFVVYGSHLLLASISLYKAAEIYFDFEINSSALSVSITPISFAIINWVISSAHDPFAI